LEEIDQLGFKLVLFSVSLLFAATHHVLALLDLLKQGQTPIAYGEHMIAFSQFTHHIGLSEIPALERRYSLVQESVTTERLPICCTRPLAR
jgi:hypothetical protein